MAEDERSDDQIEAGKTIHHIASSLLDAALNLCVTYTEDDGIFYVPVIVLVAIRGNQLLCSTVHFPANQPPEEVARVLRMSADHLEGKTKSDFWVDRNYLQ